MPIKKIFQWISVLSYVVLPDMNARCYFLPCSMVWISLWQLFFCVLCVIVFHPNFFLSPNDVNLR